MSNFYGNLIITFSFRFTPYSWHHHILSSWNRLQNHSSLSLFALSRTMCTSWRKVTRWVPVRRPSSTCWTSLPSRTVSSSDRCMTRVLSLNPGSWTFAPRTCESNSWKVNWEAVLLYRIKKFQTCVFSFRGFVFIQKVVHQMKAACFS